MGVVGDDEWKNRVGKKKMGVVDVGEEEEGEEREVWSSGRAEVREGGEGGGGAEVFI